MVRYYYKFPRYLPQSHFLSAQNSAVVETSFASLLGKARVTALLDNTCATNFSIIGQIMKRMAEIGGI